METKTTFIVYVHIYLYMSVFVFVCVPHHCLTSRVAVFSNLAKGPDRISTRLLKKVLGSIPSTKEFLKVMTQQNCSLMTETSKRKDKVSGDV